MATFRPLPLANPIGNLHTQAQLTRPHILGQHHGTPGLCINCLPLTCDQAAANAEVGGAIVAACWIMHAHISPAQIYVGTKLFEYCTAAAVGCWSQYIANIVPVALSGLVHLAHIVTGDA